MITVMKRCWDKLLSRWAHAYGVNGLLWGIAAKCLWDGSGYFAEGNKVAQGPSFEVLRSVPELGIRLHGIIMLAFALLLVRSTTVGGKFAQRTLLAMFLYADFVAVSFVVSWVETKKLVWGAPSSWFFIAHVCLWCAATRFKLPPGGKDGQ